MIYSITEFCLQWTQDNRDDKVQFHLIGIKKLLFKKSFRDDWTNVHLLPLVNSHNSFIQGT